LEKKIRGKRKLWDEEGFNKVSFVIKDCSKMEKEEGNFYVYE
jgi:hypothetical protein